MSLTSTKLWFSENDGVLGAPTPAVDGFLDNRTTSVDSSEVQDRGYGTGARVEYSTGVPYPDVILSAIKGTGEDFVYLHFAVQADQAWDDVDRLVIALRPQFSPLSAATEAIRLDISPVRDGIGAGPGALPSTPYKVKRNQPPRTSKWWKGTGATSGARWTDQGALPPGVEVKTRSWALPEPPAPYLHEFGWNVEVKLPLNATAAGSTAWEDLTSSFALYANVIRVQADPTPVSSGGFYSTQFTWPNDSTQTRYLTGSLASTLNIPDSYYGEGLVGGGPPQGLRIKRDAFGIPQIGVVRGGQITNVFDTDTAHTNTIRTVVANTDPSNAGPPTITADVRIANWGVNTPNFDAWGPVPVTGGSNPANVASPIPANGTGNGDFDWQLSASEAGVYAPPRHHQCIWVRLDAPAGDANFVESGARRNMDFINLSEYEDVAEVSARGLKPVRRRKEQDFRIFVHARLIHLDKAMITQLQREEHELPGGPEENRFWAWYAKGYRNIRLQLEIDGIVTDLWQDVGAFGHIVAHPGFDDTIKFEFPDLTEVAPGTYDVSVPNDDAIEFKYRIWSERAEKEEWSNWPRPGDGEPGEEGGGRPPIRWPKEWWKRRRLIRFPGDTRPFPRPPR